jgi:hypothetical protein
VRGAGALDMMPQPSVAAFAAGIELTSDDWIHMIDEDVMM